MVFRDDDSELGYFSYPTNDTSLAFNFRDTVAASWTSFYGNPTAGAYLSLWYWLQSGEDPWTISLNTSVDLNDSKLVELDIASEDYLGQFNLNFSFYNGSSGLYPSEFFSVVHQPSQAPLIWPAASAISQASKILGSSATAVSSSSSSSSQLGSTSLSQLSFTSPPQSTPTPSGTIQNSDPKPMTIAAVSVGAALGVVVLALVLAFLMRRSRIRRSQAGSQTSNPVKLASGAATELPGEEAGIEMPFIEVTPKELPAETLMR